MAQNSLGPRTQVLPLQTLYRMSMPPSEAFPKPSVLLVDDEEESLAFLAAALAPLGLEIVQASTGARARAELAQRRFSLILTDLRLPDMSGLDILAAARETDPLCVGVILTGHSSVDSALEALRQGAYDYLVKPCPPEILQAAVRRAVEHYELKRALIQKTAQLQRVEEQLQDKAQFIQNASHELKNPLTVVYGYSAFLLKEHPKQTPEELQRNLHSINRNAERLGHLLEELLESTRLHRHKVVLDRHPVDAENLAKEAIENIRFECAKRELSVKLEVKHPRLSIDADPKRVHQILANLLGNALKFTPEGGTLSLQVSKDGDAVRFRVQDTGVGISPSDMEGLFHRFYQAEATRGSHKGLGLGLEISKGLVELHGGKIWAESVPGQGSSFYFTVPKAPSQRPIAWGPVNAEPKDSAAAPLREKPSEEPDLA